MNNIKIKTMALTTEKAKVIHSIVDIKWNEAMKIAANCNKMNKTQAILSILNSLKSSTIADLQLLTGWDKHNLQSILRPAFRRRNSISFDKLSGIYLIENNDPLAI